MWCRRPGNLWHKFVLDLQRTHTDHQTGKCHGCPLCISYNWHAMKGVYVTLIIWARLSYPERGISNVLVLLMQRRKNKQAIWETAGPYARIKPFFFPPLAEGGRGLLIDNRLSSWREWMSWCVRSRFHTTNTAELTWTNNYVLHMNTSKGIPGSWFAC